MNQRKTYILDIDGTLLYHIGDFRYIQEYKSLQALPEVRDKITKWHCDGHMIILMTARPESLRTITESQLQASGILYDMLIMGVGQGKRIIVNDIADSSEEKARAYNVFRNEDGLQDVE